MPSFAVDAAGAVYALETSAKFRRDLKRMAKQGRDLRRLARVVERLLRGETLPPANCDHALAGDYAGARECHIPGLAAGV